MKKLFCMILCKTQTTGTLNQQRYVVGLEVIPRVAFVYYNLQGLKCKYSFHVLIWDLVSSVG